MKHILVLISFMIVGITTYSQTPSWQGKFEQLGSALSTPNAYRTASGAPGPLYWQQRADYVITAEVDDKTHVLKGSETITYHNNAPEALRYLWVQLDQNMFAENSLTKQTKTGSVRDSIPTLYFAENVGIYDNDYKGGYTIHAVKDAQGKALPYIINYTMMRIDLPTPLKTGEKFIFSIDWTFTEKDRALNSDDRGGYEFFPEDGNYVYTFAQWFPRMCVFDDMEGWQNKQFLGQAEFALSFGNYKVRITVPSDHIVGATGWLQNPKDVLSKEELNRFEKAQKTFDKPVVIVTEEEARKKEKSHSTKKSTWEFHAENVRDFAFASSRKFIWDAMAVKIGDKTPLAQSLYPKEGNPLWEKESTIAVKNALEVYSKFTLDYPYPTAISVHAANQGMEYPMICFNYGRPEKDGSYTKEVKAGMIDVVIHEVGHNFFPMIVNSDERQWSWMDEGLNTFLEQETMKERYPDLVTGRGNPSGITGYMKSDKTQLRPIMTTADNIRPREYGQNAYSKTVAALTVLRESVMGPKLFDIAFKEYAQRWAFKHPKPADFFRTMEDASAMDLDWFWKGWFYSIDHVDVEISSVKWYKLNTDKASDKKGNKSKATPAVTEESTDFSKGPTSFTLIDTPERFYGEFMNRADDAAIRKKLANKNVYEVTFKNLGGLVTPLIIEWQYKDGSKEVEQIPAEIWRVNESEAKKVFIKDKEVTAVVFDPKNQLADTDTVNNVFPRKLVKQEADKAKK
jgi:hypothetical protein